MKCDPHDDMDESAFDLSTEVQRATPAAVLKEGAAGLLRHFRRKITNDFVEGCGIFVTSCYDFAPLVPPIKAAERARRAAASGVFAEFNPKSGEELSTTGGFQEYLRAHHDRDDIARDIFPRCLPHGGGKEDNRGVTSTFAAYR